MLPLLRLAGRESCEGRACLSQTSVVSLSPIYADSRPLIAGQMISPFLDELSQQLRDVVFLKVDIDKVSALSAQMSARKAPV